MDKLLEQLKDYGADIDGAMGRFLGDVELYKTCFTIFLEDETFQKLGQALAAEDCKEAFECAHTLKGVVGNMGLTPLYQVICSIVETLRKNEFSHLQDNYAEVLRQLVSLKKLQE